LPANKLESVSEPSFNYANDIGMLQKFE